MGRRHELEQAAVDIIEGSELENETSAMPVATESTPPEGRKIRQYTPREAFARIQAILKRTPAEAHAKVLAAAGTVIELG